MNEEVESIPLFERSLSNITSNDLKGLYELEEGWFVEFKSLPPENIKIAKSISSFANAYGGILIFGVIEDQKTRRAKSFDGFSKNKAEAITLSIRQSVQAHITPSPYFEIKIIKIPETDDKNLVWVKVPKGNAGPYLHSSGVIYSRTGDSSTPIHLNDLGLLERMWRDSESHKQKIKKRIELLSGVLTQHMPRIEIFICEDENNPNDYHEVSFIEFKKLALGGYGNGTVSIFNSAYPLDSSFIAQRINATAFEIGILWDYDHKRKLHHISIPLSTINWKDGVLDMNPENIKNYARLDKYLNISAKEQDIFLVDMSYCVGLISQVFTKIYELRKITNSKNNIFFNAKVSGVKKSLAVINLSKFYEELNSGVVPIIFRDPDFVFPIEDYQKWFALKFSNINNKPGFEHEVSNAISIFIKLCTTIGITTYSTMGQDENDNTDPEDLVQLFSKLLTENYSFKCEPNPHY